MEGTEKSNKWIERLDIFSRALDKLSNVVTLSRQHTLNEYERDSLIKRFEFTYEMAWKLMMSYEKWSGISQILGSRDVIRHAAAQGLIDNGEAWLDMIDARNQTSHTYDEDMATDLADFIIHTHYPLFIELRKKMAEIANQN